MKAEILLKNLVLATVSILFVASCSVANTPPAKTAPVAQIDSLVSTQWLSEHLNDPDLVVLDCSVLIEMDGKGGMRSLSGRASYDAGHIPTAGFADLMTELSDSESPFQFAVPSHERFRAVMGALGVGDNTKVVLYDNSNSAWAARVWWMLRWVGFDNAAILNGGQGAWVAEGRKLSTQTVKRKTAELTTPLRPELIADRDDVLNVVETGSATLIDSLFPPQYSGEMTMYDRPGHIKGAINVSVGSIRAESGHFKADSELASLFEDSLDTPTITYCGGGIAASANAFVMTRLGYTDVAVYINSLQEWAADPSNPMETSPEVVREAD